MTERVFAIEETPASTWRNIDEKFGMIGRHVKPAMDNASPIRGIYAGSCFMPEQPRNFRPEVLTVCRLSGGSKVIAAGGYALALAEMANGLMYYNNIDRGSNSKFSASDLDLYIRATNQSEALDTIRGLLEYLNPTGTVVRTKYALSLQCDIGRCIEELGWPCVRYDPRARIIKVQIIDRAIPRTSSIENDISYLFQTFDLDCCKWASDGHSMYTTEAASEAYVSRVCNVPWSKITDSTIPRMARYFSRCYDFVIEGYDPRNVFFPCAVEKIVEILRTKETPHDLPPSNYSSTTNIGNTPMFQMFKAHGQTGADPYMICGTKEDAMHMIVNGTQPETYMFDWCMETMNKMAETVLWLVSPGHDEERSNVREYCANTIEEWKQIMSQRVRFAPMFAEPIKFMGLSSEIFEKYWHPVAIEKTYNVV